MMAVEPRLMNQFKTTADLVLQVKNAKDATAIDKINAGSGTPDLVVFAKIFGARPCLARPKTVREAWNRRQLVQLQADVMTTALHKSGRNGIFNRSMAMMNGDLATPFPEAIALTTVRQRIGNAA